jgi:cytochrome c oxidase cbb3-type subunit I/II
MIDPRTMTPGSIMPAYDWLAEQTMDVSNIKDKINAMRTLGVPYEKGYEDRALQDLEAQAKGISDNLALEKIKISSNKELISLIAYLQRLGTDIKLSNTTSTK